MLQTLLTWHVTATALLLLAYVLVALAQWAVARVRRSGAQARAAVVPVPAARREGEAGHAVVGTAA